MFRERAAARAALLYGPRRTWAGEDQRLRRAGVFRAGRRVFVRAGSRGASSTSATVAAVIARTIH